MFTENIERAPFCFTGESALQFGIPPKYGKLILITIIIVQNFLSLLSNIHRQQNKTK